MKMVFVISSLTCGGAERVISILANYYAARGEEVTLVTFARLESDFYGIDKRVKRVGLDLLKDSSSIISGLTNNAIRVIKLRRVIQDISPGVVVSFMHQTNVITLLSTLGMTIPVIISERNDHQSLGSDLWEKLRHLVYSQAKAVVVQTEAMHQWATGFVPAARVFTIPNPVLPVTGITETESPMSEIMPATSPFIAAMGRLVPQKGFDMLLEAFSICSHSTWSLVILGEGVDKGLLALQAESLGIADRVHFAGKIQQPARVLSHAKIFVLSSRFEGFPNALLEAMSLSLPVISFDCPSGPSDIVDNGVNGLLVAANDVQGLAKKMDYLMGDEALRRRLGQQAGNVVERYSLNKIVAQWDRLLVED